MSCPSKAPGQLLLRGRKRNKLLKRCVSCHQALSKLDINMGHIYYFCGPSTHGSVPFRTSFPFHLGIPLHPLYTYTEALMRPATTVTFPVCHRGHPVGGSLKQIHPLEPCLGFHIHGL